MKLLFISMSPRGPLDPWHPLPAGPEALDTTGDGVYLWPRETRALYAAVGLAGLGHQIVFCTRNWSARYAGVEFRPVKDFARQVLTGGPWDCVLTFGTPEPLVALRGGACVYDFGPDDVAVGTNLRAHIHAVLVQSETQGYRIPGRLITSTSAIPYHVLPGGFDAATYRAARQAMSADRRRIGYWSRPGPLLCRLLEWVGTTERGRQVEVFGLRPDLDVAWIERCLARGIVVHPPLAPKTLAERQAMCGVAVVDTAEGEFSRATVEALALGCATIVGDHAVNVEYWGELVRRSSTLVEALPHALHDPTPSVAECWKVVANWTWAHAAEELRDTIMLARTMAGTVGHDEMMHATTGIPLLVARAHVTNAG